MDKKYIKFYKTFHKKFKNDENLILCSNTLCDGGVVWKRELFSRDLIVFYYCELLQFFMRIHRTSMRSCGRIFM